MRRKARRRTQRAGSRGAWSGLLERASRTRRPGDIAAARAAFTALPERDQRQVAHEIAETRRAELTLAYADIVAVSSGYRLAERRGVRRVQAEVCVTLVVKRKRKKGRVAKKHRAPEELFAYWSVDGRRVLCAVPTDVEDAARLSRIRPHAQIEARASGTHRPSPGMIACVLTRGGDGTPYVIGCRHVFGMALLLDPAKHHDATIHPVGSATILAHATGYAGELENGLEYSFDSHLAHVEAGAEAELREVLGDVRFGAHMASWDDLEHGVDYFIRTPRGVIRANFAGLYTEPLRYTGRLNDIRHFQLAKFLLPDEPTTGGDSGAPVMTRRDGDTLVGMLIAGDNGDTAIVIPAWQLFYAPWYGLGQEAWSFWP